MPFDINNYSSPYDNLDYRTTINNAFTSQGQDAKYTPEQMAQPSWLPAEQIMTNIWGSPAASPFAGVYDAAKAQQGPTATPLSATIANATAPAPAAATQSPMTAPASKNLSGDTLSWLNNQFSQYTPNSGSTRYTDANGQTWTAGTTGSFGTGENNAGETPTLTGWFRDQQNGNNQNGALQDMFDTKGNYTGSAAVKGDDWLDKLMPVLLGGFGAAAGMGLLASGAAGAAGGAGAAIGPGEAGWGAGLDSTIGAGSGSGALGTIGGPGATAAGAGVTPGVFNAAADSQAANAAIAAAGGDPLAGYVGAGTISAATPGFTGAGTTAATTAATAAGRAINPVDAAKIAATVAGAAAGGNSGGVGGGSDLLSTILKLAAGGSDSSAQKKASDDMLAYLRERQGINDNMYKQGSPEYNALWDEMSRKDAAAGRNSQYGPRSVDLAARVAQLKMDANTKMTTGISSLYKNALDQRASSNAGLLSALGNLGGSGGSLSSLLGMITKSLGTGNIPGTNFRDPTSGSPINAPGGANFGGDIGFDDPFGR